MRMFRPLAAAALVATVAALCVLVAFDQRELFQTAEAVNSLSAEVDQATKAQAVKPANIVKPERDVRLPNDGQAYYVSVIVRPDYVKYLRDREVVGWWRGHRRLVVLAGQTHFNLYANTDPIYKTNLAHIVGGCPAVLVQDAKGNVVYSSWDGDKLPNDADTLADHIAIQLDRKAGAILPWRRRYESQPTPSPSPEPGPDISVTVNRPVVEDLPPRPVVPNGKGNDADFWIILAIAVAASAVAAFIIEFKREAKGAP